MSIGWEQSVDVGGPADEGAVAARYGELIDGWNARDGSRFPAPFVEDATVLGFDGSETRGHARSRPRCNESSRITRPPPTWRRSGASSF